MPKYQIRFCDSKGHGSFCYVDGEKNVEQLAADKATEYINRDMGFGAFGRRIESKKTVHVWEMDMVTKQPKKGGHRFKLKLAYVQATYTDGSKTRKEWYEPELK